MTPTVANSIVSTLFSFCYWLLLFFCNFSHVHSVFGLLHSNLLLSPPSPVSFSYIHAFCFALWPPSLLRWSGYWLGAIHWRFVGSSFWNITQGYTAPPPKSSISNSTTRKGRTSLMPPWSMLTLTGPVCVGLVQAIIVIVWFWLQ